MTGEPTSQGSILPSQYVGTDQDTIPMSGALQSTFHQTTRPERETTSGSTARWT